jgi:hypothetical protein
MAERRIARQVVHVEDRVHVAQRCPVMFAISDTVAPNSASRVTAVPRRSWNVTSRTPAAAHALRQDARNPSEVNGLPSLLVRMIGDRFAAESSAALRGVTTRIGGTGLPVLDCRSRICVPS